MLFWPEISALGVFFYFDNERMRPPEYPSAPPPLPPGCTDTLKKVLLDWSVSKIIWAKFAMCASFVCNLFLQSTNTSGDLYRRNLGKNDVRQNPVMTALKVNAE